MTRAEKGSSEDGESWEVYIVETRSGKLYTGISTDAERRLAEHRSSNRGARFFRFESPRRLVYREACADRGAASRRERQIKSMRRAEKLELIAHAAPSGSGEQSRERNGSEG